MTNAERFLTGELSYQESSSRLWAQLVPSMHTQLVLNDIAGTSLLDHMHFLRFMKDYSSLMMKI